MSFTEKDFLTFKDRVHVYALDLRVIPQVEEFVEFVKAKYPRLDGIINNAAQTIRRPPVYYAHLIQRESAHVDGNQHFHSLQ
jgi:NAD(P)-dependent dehydrogenase (short-subunit alcohol dehydrogenase family)